MRCRQFVQHTRVYESFEPNEPHEVILVILNYAVRIHANRLDVPDGDPAIILP